MNNQQKQNFELLSEEFIASTINRSNCCHIALHGEIYPYIVPMYYTLETKDNKIIFKLNTKSYGEKMKLLEANQNVTLEIEVFNYNSIDIIIVNGIAKLKPNKNEVNYYEGCNIKIIPEKITGRRFYF